MCHDALGRAALVVARQSIAQALGRAGGVAPDLAELSQPAATFVTLKHAGDLRGCIGTLSVRRTLREDVRHNAVAAAFEDARFGPLTEAEFERIAIEVSLLSAMQRFVADTEAHAIEVLRPGHDGVLLEFAERRATFLPQVWNDVPDARKFLALLKRKAGLAADFWSPDLRLSRYSVTRWREVDFDLDPQLEALRSRRTRSTEKSA